MQQSKGLCVAQRRKVQHTVSEQWTRIPTSFCSSFRTLQQHCTSDTHCVKILTECYKWAALWIKQKRERFPFVAHRKPNVSARQKNKKRKKKTETVISPSALTENQAVTPSAFVVGDADSWSKTYFQCGSRTGSRRRSGPNAAPWSCICTRSGGAEFRRKPGRPPRRLGETRKPPEEGIRRGERLQPAAALWTPPCFWYHCWRSAAEATRMTVPL